MSLISHLTKKQQDELFSNLNYMNIAELKYFCNKQHIPYIIMAEYETKKLRKTRNIDRKGIIIARIKHYLRTGKVKGQTTFSKAVISSEQLPSPLKPTHRVYYSQYKRDKTIIKLMKQLTDEKFKFGAISQEVLRDCWSKGIAPTYKEFAGLWLKAYSLHKKPNPEWAFLTDKHLGVSYTNWKKLRNEKAGAAIKILDKLYET